MEGGKQKKASDSVEGRKRQKGIRRVEQKEKQGNHGVHGRRKGSEREARSFFAGKNIRPFHQQGRESKGEREEEHTLQYRIE